MTGKEVSVTELMGDHISHLARFTGVNRETITLSDRRAWACNDLGQRSGLAETFDALEIGLLPGAWLRRIGYTDDGEIISVTYLDPLDLRKMREQHFMLS